MDSEYSLDWLKGDIDSTMLFVLRSGKESLSSFQVQDILTDGIEQKEIKFANIKDFDNFVNLGMVRFTDFNDLSNFVEIPIRNLYMLYGKAKGIGEGESTGIGIEELHAFSIYDGSVIGKGYAIYPYKVNEVSDELNSIMNIASKYGSMSMNDKIDALEELNLINYQRNNVNKMKK